MGQTRVAMVTMGVLAGALFSFAAATSTSDKVFAPLGEPSLHNAHRVTDKVLSGAQPDGEEAFKALARLGVETIIGVDGAKPDVASAKKIGMRYVHLPIGYDGVDPAEAKAIAKAINELPGLIYLHCHHGKHRSAAAVAVACVMNSSLDPTQAEDVLETFGTGLNYKGLWQAARDARALDPAELQALDVDFVETAKVGDLAESMVKIDQHWEHLKSIQKSGWRPPPDHPDLDPAHEALMVQEHFHEAARLDSADQHSQRFRTLLNESESAARSLLEILLASPTDARAADRAFTVASESCTSCHTAFRD